MVAQHMTDSIPLHWQRFIGGIADLRFERYLTMQLLPIFYVLLLLGAVLVLAAITALCFWFSGWLGLATLVVSPVLWLMFAALVRAALEYLVMAYRIMLTVQKMDSITTTVVQLATEVESLQSRLGGITANVQDIHTGFADIRHQVQHVRNQVDHVTTTVDMARPILQPLGLAQKLLRGWR